ncbi:hypothetical protein GCM10010324_67660 [Streptomyces hiroshimensis]|uniref:Uncharacterized protein n=1 Tax=Streptomyces hiroshimensis TaxID=66424 RepID=A0ABQ2ZDM0_9ACTN|nr:hypothetical protein GCM10010324_67660 [Streptomyces hiroshimensis]
MAQADQPVLGPCPESRRLPVRRDGPMDKAGNAKYPEYSPCPWGRFLSGASVRSPRSAPCTCGGAPRGLPRLQELFERAGWWCRGMVPWWAAGWLVRR